MGAATASTLPLAARAFVLGLLDDLSRKGCWAIAEHAGDASPDGMQHLLALAL